LDDSDATLSYSVARGNGQVEPLLSPQDLDQLASTFRPGIVLQGRYVLERELGRGAMGIVFLGRDNRLGRPVAVKAILPRDLGSRARGTTTALDLRDRFTEEARIGANLTHPAIATVHDFGIHGESLFTVFEYVDGPTLGELTKRRGTIPLEEVRLIIAPLAQALDFAHSRFIIHRDLKPANIKFDGQGHLKILDLGLATEFRRHSDWSGFAGTPAYASPEQAAGLAADGRSDQYALALIAYELLAGRRLFSATRVVELLEMHRSQVPPPIRSLVPHIPEAVEGAILQALRKDPDQRFLSCESFAVALGCRFLSDGRSAGEIELEADVQIVEAEWSLVPVHIVLSWLARYRLVPGSGEWSLVPAHIVLTPTALLFIEYQSPSLNSLLVHHNIVARVERRPLNGIISIKHDGSYRIRVETGKQVAAKPSTPEDEEKVIEFRTKEQRDQWLIALRRRHEELVAPLPKPESLENTQIVTLRGRPIERFLFLGKIEGFGSIALDAKLSLLTRAAVMGADAVLETQQEYLPGPRKNVWLVSGTAVRSVTAAGHRQIGLRWFEETVRKVTVIALGLAALNAALSTGLLSALMSEELGPEAPVVETALIQFVSVIAILLPLILLRLLLWPQLARPAAVACMLYVLGPGGGAAGLTGLSLVAFVPLALGIFLARSLTIARATYMALVANDETPPPALRRAAGVASYTYLGVIALVILIGSIGVLLSEPVKYGGDTRTLDRADGMVATGRLDLRAEPAKAAATFRKALELYYSVTQAHPVVPEIAVKAAYCRMYLGTALFDSGNLADAEGPLTTALGEMEHLPAESSDGSTIRQARCFVRCKLAQIMARRRDPQRAIALLEDNLREDSRDAISLKLLAHYSLDQGKPTRAMDELNRVIDLTNGGDAETWFLMSMAYYHVGERTKGRTWYDKATGWMEANAPRDPYLVWLRGAVVDSAR
jgi:serine/threonine protein kinase